MKARGFFPLSPTPFPVVGAGVRSFGRGGRGGASGGGPVGIGGEDEAPAKAKAAPRLPDSKASDDREGEAPALDLKGC